MRPFPELLRLSKTYWIVCPKATAALPKIVTFREWLLAEASIDLRQLKKLGWSLRPMERKGTDLEPPIVPGAISTITFGEAPSCSMPCD